jgi:hypothetical protein
MKSNMKNAFKTSLPRRWLLQKASGVRRYFEPEVWGVWRALSKLTIRILSGEAKIAGPIFGWTFWNLAGITEYDFQRMPAPKARSKKKQQHKLSNAIALLEIEVARSGERAARRDALFPDLPTRALRRRIRP